MEYKKTEISGGKSLYAWTLGWNTIHNLKKIYEKFSIIRIIQKWTSGVIFTQKSLPLLLHIW